MALPISSDRTILVTGGAGFIGSHLVDRLLPTGCRVVVIDNFNDFYDPEIKRSNISSHLEQSNYRLFDIDIRNDLEIDEVFKSEPIDTVVHLAAMAGVRPSIADPVLYNEVNLLGTLNILEACRSAEVPRLVFASSSSVYGNNEKIPFHEDDPVDHPISPYASTKKSGELMVHTYHHLFGIGAVCLRFFTVYGPRQRPEMAIHLFTDRIFRGEAVDMYGEGDSERDYTYIDDIIDGIMACLEREFDYQVINLGRSDTVKLSELISMIEERLKKKAEINRLPMQPGDVNRTYADINRARELLGFEPKVSISEGLDKFVAWYLDRQGAE